jgi:hypothetical protein
MSDDLRSVDDLLERWQLRSHGAEDREQAPTPEESESIVGRISSWETPQQTGDWVTYQVTFGEPAGADVSVPPSVLPWRRVFVGAIMAGSMLLLGLWFLRVSTRLGWLDFLARHPHVAWLILGLCWWLLMSPSVVGALIVAVGLLHAAVKALRRWDAPKATAKG